jgi:hypothetical protein
MVKRHGPDGKVTEPVSEDHRLHAAQRLAELTGC